MGFLIWLASSFSLCIPAWYVARKRQSWFEWDYATVLAPIPIWFALALARIGAQSMANLVEVLIIAAFVPVAVSCRVFLLDGKWNNPTRNSLAVFLLCGVVLPLGLRLAMPELSE